MTRSQNTNMLVTDRTKRKANSPAKGMTLKRSAFGDVTNALKKSTIQDPKKKGSTTTHVAKKVTVQTKILPMVKTIPKLKPQKENIEPPEEPKKKIVTRLSLRNILPAQTDVAKPKENGIKIETRVKTRLSNEFDKSDESLYTSALESL